MRTALLALLVAVGPPGARTYEIEPARSTVRFHIVHKFHRVTGASSTIEGKAVLSADGWVRTMVRVPMASFDSGERNRDADMREAVDARGHPFVTFRGVARLPPEAFAGTQAAVAEVRMDGEVELRGVKRPVSVPLLIELSAGAARARGSFEVSLDAFGVTRPSLLFVKIDDACRIDVDVALREARP